MIVLLPMIWTGKVCALCCLYSAACPYQILDSPDVQLSTHLVEVSTRSHERFSKFIESFLVKRVFQPFAFVFDDVYEIKIRVVCTQERCHRRQGSRGCDSREFT